MTNFGSEHGLCNSAKTSDPSARRLCLYQAALAASAEFHYRNSQRRTAAG
jgi:hypothetical protein